MKKFANLIRELEQTRSDSIKEKTLVEYFTIASDDDKLWAISLLLQQRPKRMIPINKLRPWAIELADISDWLFDACMELTRDLAETISLIIPLAKEESDKSLNYWLLEMTKLKKQNEAIIKTWVLNACSILDIKERYFLLKLLTGGFRTKVSQKVMVNALSTYLEKDSNQIAHRLLDNWSPVSANFEEWMLSENNYDTVSKPFPFKPAFQIEKDISELGKEGEWLAEWKWDGIRCQFIFRDGNIFIWSSRNELLNAVLPELSSIAEGINYNFVMLGELLAFRNGSLLDFQELTKRINRKTSSKKLLESTPIVFMAYDILEYKNQIISQEPLIKRRKELENFCMESKSENIMLSEGIEFNTWNELSPKVLQARSIKMDGIVLKKKKSSYNEERSWWKWRAAPYTINAVLLYAQRDRNNLYSEFTFALWENDQMIPFTKTNSGLSKEEIHEVTAFVKKNTIERFGPVRSVSPELVFEIVFDGISESTKHKSGIVLRSSRILKWRKEKKAGEANTLADIKGFLKISYP